MSEAKLLSRRIAYKGSHIQVREDRVIEPAGHECSREIVVHPGAVCIVARPSPEEVVLIRQYRHATGQELLEIPAGTLHDGEDPLACAFRELEEETGYRAATMTERARFWTTPGFTTEFMHLYEAAGLTKTQSHPDEDEVIEVHIVSRAEALQLIDNGRIQDAKSILGLLRVFNSRSGSC
ncbi:MAG: ADP-ribose pyrophosphatase [Acidobacteria bacterium]|nr:MAG: ADP-ribose pyrophosphatase [Acidobacteriota bacterium]